MEGVTLVRDLTVEVGPELDQEEGVGGSLPIQLLQTVRLLRKLVLDLPHINRLRKNRFISKSSYVTKDLTSKCGSE